jgi:transcriptional regulator with XRE-family HTH domain
MHTLPVNNILCILNNSLCTQSVIHFAVRTKQQALADFVRQQMTQGERTWSTHEVARRAKAAGYSLSNGTVQNILNCKQKNEVNDASLYALAHVFGVPPKEIIAIYHGTSLNEAEKGDAVNGTTAKIIGYAEELPPDVRHQLLLISETLWKESKKRKDDKGKKKAS